MFFHQVGIMLIALVVYASKEVNKFCNFNWGSFPNDDDENDDDD